MSPDWFDPLGIRGSKLDPFAMFSAALKGEGVAQQSAEAMATMLARRLVGRRVEVDRDPPMAATVDRIHEVTPVTALAAMPTVRGEVPMWQRVRGRISDVKIGERSLHAVDLTVTGVCLFGASSQRLRVERVDFDATVTFDEVERWAADVDGNHLVRVTEGRLEVTDRRVARWAWVEVSVTAAARTVLVMPLTLRVFGRTVPLPSRLRRPIERRVEWLPGELIVTGVRVTPEAIGVQGELGDVLVPVDVTRLLSELGTLGTRSVLRIVIGDR